MNTPATTLLFSLLLTALASAREWTSSDGRKLEADLVSAANGQVTLKRAADGRVFTLALDQLSAEDQAFIQSSPATPAVPAKPIEGPLASLITGDWALADFEGLPYALYASKDLSAAASHPLVIALHGRSQNNENGKQIGGWMRSFTQPERYAKNPCIIVAPLGYQPYGGTGSAWNDKPGAQALKLITHLLKNLPIDKNRVYCAGFSMGGFGTCHFIHSDPRLFAAGVAVAGCTGPDTAPSFKKTPIWLFHAVDDATVEVKYSRDLAAALSRNKDCKYTEYPSGGHGIAGTVFETADVHDWLFAQGGK